MKNNWKSCKWTRKHIPAVIMLLDRVRRLIRTCSGLIWVFELQDCHVEYGNSISPWILRFAITASISFIGLSGITRIYASDHDHLIGLCGTADVFDSGGIREVRSKPTKGRQWEHIHLSGFRALGPQDIGTPVNDSVQSNFVSMNLSSAHCCVGEHPNARKTYISKLSCPFPWTPTAQ